MKPETLGLVLGGVLPAFLFAIDGVSSKAAARTGMSWAPFMIATGLTIALAGVVALYFDDERRFTPGGAGFAILKGAVWALGSILVVVALTRFGAPLAKLAPLYNMNALIAAALALVLFREHTQVDTVRLLGGALLVVGGAALVATA
jgi:uncharacterized membrane protein